MVHTDDHITEKIAGYHLMHLVMILCYVAYLDNSGIINQPAGFKGGWDPALSHCHAAPVTRHTLLGYKQAEHALSRRLTKEA